MSTRRRQLIEYMQKKGVVRPRDLQAVGLPRDYLYQMMKKGLVVSEVRGLYRLADDDSEVTEWNSFVQLQRRVPSGVFCLLSALVFHQFTSQNPHQLWLSIGHKAWQPEVDYPPVRFIRMSGAALDDCIEVHEIEGVGVRVYSAAKTVADCFKFRNQVGLDVAIEALKEGWRLDKFSMDELMVCAKICRVANVIQPYAESVAHR